jgi:hypothetical protein
MPTRTIKTFADLRAAIAEAAAETPPVANPPMSPEAVRHSAEALAVRRRREAGRVVRLTPRPNVVAFKPPPGPPQPVKLT